MALQGRPRTNILVFSPLDTAAFLGSFSPSSSALRFLVFSAGASLALVDSSESESLLSLDEEESSFFDAASFAFGFSFSSSLSESESLLSLDEEESSFFATTSFAFGFSFSSSLSESESELELESDDEAAASSAAFLAASAAALAAASASFLSFSARAFFSAFFAFLSFMKQQQMPYQC